ncbi:hypothetical protein DK867_23535 [Ochrobactrum sp. POC9]|uniref:putative bifunctional diguanylate cyclase/phosphodiesterase n=1 Tax=Ochrobactrum sp. POC9 TaxID=2203419 RepID=UPI000D70683B|nr:bifunctional diguanylate cyclase/phosphodiesterase [Ochrobactrum sp. POC9]PWU70671.1 hypothetical protein DK867_23535 [Ochrobactrum sp. POC9]
MLLLLTLQFIVLSFFPLYFTTLPAPMRLVHFYVYLALVLLIGGFMGNVYSVSITDSMDISGGSLCYGAFMMASVMFVWIERDAFILRHLVRLVIVVDIFKVIFSFLTYSFLESNGIINPHDVPPEMFKLSTPMIILGGVLIIAELLILLFIFEFTKKKTGSFFVNGVVYIVAFVLVLVLDGFAFFFISFGINADILALVFGGITAKVFMATAFGLTLGLFIVWQQRVFTDYLESDTFRWRLLTSSSANLIKEIDRQDQDVRRGDIVFKNSSEGLAIFDESGALLRANFAFRKMLRISVENNDIANLKQAFWIANKPVVLPSHFAGPWRREVAFGQNQQRAGILSITPVEEGIHGQRTQVYSLIDITEQKLARQRLEYVALHDQLTGLPNRRFLDQYLNNLRDSPYALIAVDLDRFRDINDSYGHSTGDRVLQVIGERLHEFHEAHMGENDILCNVGIDAFVFLVHSNDRGFVEPLLEQIQRTIEQTIRIDDNLAVFTTATIGISYQRQGRNVDTFLEANAALYAAKRKRRGTIAVYQEGLTDESRRKMVLALKLKTALADNLLDVHYQPQFDTVSRKLRGVEALARWTDPELGVISPSEFIPVAEATGLIDPLGEYVLERACRDGQEWRKNWNIPVTVSVNVSAQQLRFGRFALTLTRILNETNFPAHQLEVELTESSYIEREEEVTPLLSELKEMGVGIAIDDFGTGYSSLSYLRDLPCDYIKIDRSFITGIPLDPKQCSLTSAVIQLAKSVSFKVVAEGVETQEQLDFLASQGCDLIQGHYFSPALSKNAVEAMLAIAEGGAR